jgi:hypothetical protein
LLVISILVIWKFHFIHKIEVIQVSVIANFGFIGSFNLSKTSRNTGFVFFFKNQVFRIFTDFFKSFTVWFKKYFTRKRPKVIHKVHTFDFSEVNNTQLKYTAKYRNKKNSSGFDLYDIKIDLKNLNPRQIAGLFIGITYGYHNSPFKEEKELFHEFENIAHEFHEFENCAIKSSKLFSETSICLKH